MTNPTPTSNPTPMANPMPMTDPMPMANPTPMTDPMSLSTAPALPTEQLPYHRMARFSTRHRWWRSVLGTGFLAVGCVFAAVVVYGVFEVLGVVRGYPTTPDGTVEFGPVSGTAADLLAIASALPVVLLAVLWIGRRPAGTVSSVTGGLRWRWLGWCVLAALLVLAVTTVVLVLLPVDDGPPARWAGWEVFGPALAMLVVLVPLQAAAEEYVFRGWLLQAVGGLLRSPWWALVPQAVLFAAAHGWGTPWGFADLLVFAMVAGWLTVRTGGLEAAIGLHAVNNLLAFGVSAAVVDGLTTDETAADAPWQLVAVDLTGVALYAVAVLWLARRRTPTRTVPAPAAVAPVHPAAYPWVPAAYAAPRPGVAVVPVVPGVPAVPVSPATPATPVAPVAPAPYAERPAAPDLLPEAATPSDPPPGTPDDPSR
ncbi:lysostaphin resistance A-like protein [Streptomyces sp. NPDC088387]|uniref:CPBP family intramembrane glutamic endopeptidase n=1 Tax=Streptomyces sp. NPDC088387 TaxID=3365859 RepID=UPI0037F9F611